MKKIILIIIISFSFNYSMAQNLILNPSFEEYWGTGFSNGNIIFSNSFDTLAFPNTFEIKNWIALGNTPDAFWKKSNDFPANFVSNYVYPHTDSIIVGGVYFCSTACSSSNVREIIEGKLIKPLVSGHLYQLSFFLQLFDTMYYTGAGKMVGINSFSALFTSSELVYQANFPVQNYNPQVQITTMVTDTQHWVQLIDTFIAAGGEQYVSFGNFKQDGQFQYQLVDSLANLPEVAYYFMDDVSLIDITPLGVEEVGVNKLEVYPNPVSSQLTVSSNQFKVNTIEVTNVLGQLQNVIVEKLTTENCQLNTENLPSGIYFIKATDTNGNVSVGKFVKE